MFEIHSIRGFLFSELIALFAVFGVILLLQAYLTFQHKAHLQNTQKIKEHLFKKYLVGNVQNFPKFPLKGVVNALIDLDESLKGIGWEALKKEVLLPHQKTLCKYATSKSTKKQMIGMRAALLSSSIFDEKTIKTFLFNTPLQLKYESVQLACRHPNESILKEILDQLTLDRGYVKYIIRDCLLHGGEKVFQMLLKIFRDETREYRKISCLEVLSQKVGYLTIDDIRPCVESKNIHLKWWGLKALENAPCSEGLSLLLANAESEYVDIRTVVASTLGNFSYEKVVETLGELLVDTNWLVRLYAAFSLRRFDTIGLAFMKERALSHGEEVQATIDYILAVKSETNPRMMIKWLDARAMR